NTVRSVFPHNLTRQLIGHYNGWNPDEGERNVLYIWYNTPNSGTVYTPNNNFTVYDRKFKH
ncbi:MAG: hypothetical protein FWG18_03160, partial [Alphaproteobacteria bacterium]|nr:hypothetical protein [Alphaproteobacteria bacterium]